MLPKDEQVEVTITHEIPKGAVVGPFTVISFIIGDQAHTSLRYNPGDDWLDETGKPVGVQAWIRLMLQAIRDSGVMNAPPEEIEH